MKEYSSIIPTLENPKNILLFLLGLGFFVTGLYAQTDVADQPQSPAAVVSPESTDDIFELPDFMQEALVLSQEDGDVEIAPNDGESFTNTMSVSDLVVAPRQKLYRQSVADIRFEEVPVRDALRYLAEAAGINYVLPALETDSVTLNMRMPPFNAMESLADNFGLGIYEEGDLWFIRKKDKARYFAKIYKIRNIHLGNSTSGGGASNDDDDNNDNNNSTTTNSDGTTTTTSSSTTSTNTSSSSTSSGGGDVVMTTLREILGIDAAFGGTIQADGTMSGERSSSGSAPEVDDDDDTQTSDYTYVSYDADANTLFIIATATQHEWVQEYLNAIDNPTTNIAIEAMFLESSMDPTSVMGVDWEGSSSLSLSTTGETADGTGSAGDTLPFGTVKNPQFPWDALIESNTFSTSIRAFTKKTDSHIARYPSVVTQNGREVKIETVQHIPLSALEQVASNDTSYVVGIEDLGTQDIGTTITITPRQINEKLVQLDIDITISTASGSSDSNTNRVSTNETSYKGMVNVPAGYTLAIGGLERIQEDIATKKMPGLGDIPLFGFLFKDTGKSFNRSNVFLFITPTILKSDNPDTAFMTPSEGLSRDWIEKANAEHRGWRRESVDPRIDKQIRQFNK